MILDPQIRMKKSDMRNRFVYSCGFGHMVWQEYITRRKYMGALGSIFLIVGIFFTDLWIKNKIEGFGAENKREKSAPQESGGEKLPDSLWGGRILIRKYHNSGAMLNLGGNHRAAVTILSVSLAVILSVVFVLSLGRRGSHMLRLGLALLLGGAFSNTYDRLKRHYVVDYFSFNVKWKPIRQIVFNLSDFCIIIGAMLMVIGLK